MVGRTVTALTETATGYPTIHTLSVDLAEPESADIVVATALREIGRVDVLVNNASIAIPAPLVEIDPIAVHDQLNINLRAPILLTQRAIDALTATRGTVMNISSAGSLGRRAWPGFSVYGAGKVALEFLTRTWAVELAPRGIRVVAIAPGVIATGMGVRMGASVEDYDRFLDEMATRTPLGRVGTSEEIAWWAYQLAASQAGYVTGTVFAVDGGASIA